MLSATRITNLDFIRGVALLGILVINVISFGLPITALFNHSTYGAENLFCLLYTSPSPRDPKTSRMPSSA